METAQIMMMPVADAAAPAGSIAGCGDCSGAAFGSLLGQTLALLEQSGISSTAGELTQAASEQPVQQMVPQAMPEVAVDCSPLLERVGAEQEQQPLQAADGNQERAQQLAGFLQAALLVPAPLATAAVVVPQADEAGVPAATEVLGAVQAPVVAEGTNLPLLADDQQAVQADQPEVALQHQVVTGHGMELHRPVVQQKQAGAEAGVVHSVQNDGRATTTEQQQTAAVVTEPAVRTEMTKAATVAAAVEGKPVAVDQPATAKVNAAHGAQVRLAQPTAAVTATAQPEQKRQQEQGQLGQQQARLADGTLQQLDVSEQPEETTQFQLQMTAATDVESPHGQGMGVMIQRTAGGQLEVQATEPAKVAAEAQLMRQVSDRLETHELKQGTDRISLRLSPEHLGNLQLNLRVEDQQVRVEIVAEHRAVRDALLQQVDQLKETLSRQNIKMESFDVITANNGGLTQQQQGDWRQAASERRPLYEQQYGTVRSAGAAAGGTEVAMQYFAPQYQSTLDVRF